MTPERAWQIVGRFRQYRDIGEAMDIPAMWAEIWAESGWHEIGYESWDALCVEALGGWRLALPRGERREAAAEMAGKGMSTRAIGSALGVDHTTVVRDLSAGGADAPPRTGLDGKTYPARVTQTTRTTDATKTEQVVDLATGEILGDLVTSEQWDRENRPGVEEMLAADPDVIAANVRKAGASFMVALHRPLPISDLAAVHPALVQEIADRLQFLADQYRAAIPTRLSIVKES